MSAYLPHTQSCWAWGDRQARLMMTACLFLWAWAGIRIPASRAEETPQRVMAVDVEGNRTIAKDTCLAQLQTRPGMPYVDNVVSEDIRRLYALGYFTDVRVQTEPLPEGLKVVFVVKEKPAIGSIDVEGQRRFRKERIREWLGVKPGELYDPRKLKDGLDKILNEYHRKGYAQADVEQAVSVEAASNTAAVHLIVDEGPRLRIKDIWIEGNLAFSDRQLRRLMKTTRKHLVSSGVYTPQVLEEDLERIRAFYRKHGYQDVAVDKDVLTVASGQWLAVYVKVTEGLQHRVGQVAITGAMLFPEGELRALLTLKPGSVYSTDALQEDLRAIKQYYGDRGYINAQVVPETQLDQATKRVNLTVRIIENDLAYIHRIEVQGNLRTKDVVIRRELRVYPGEPFHGKQVRRSIERLYNLGIFEEVNVQTQPTAHPSQEDLVVSVKEAKTGSFSFGGGVSSVDRLVGMVEVEQRNFDLTNFPTCVGAGEDLRLRAEMGTVRRFFDLSFTEPWIFGHPLSLGFDAYNRTRLRSRNLGLAFEEAQRGGGIRLGKEFTDELRLDVGYQLFRTEISNVADDASADLKAEQGRSNISEGSLTLTWDVRDNRFDPTRGFTVFSSMDLAGGLLAGDEEFYRLQSGASAYFPHLNDRLVFENRIRAGMVRGYSKTHTVPVFERFFAGGADTIRGFRERRVGPRDPISNDPIGGEAILIGTLEEVMTVVKDERGKPILKGSVFWDMGNVWRKVGDLGSSFKAGTGVGMRVNTPIGPVRVDVGYPVTKPDDNKKRTPRLHFNISRSF